MATAQTARTHCPAGHPYDEENTLISGGRRHCRRCGRGRARRYGERRRRAEGAQPARVWTTESILAEHVVVPKDLNDCWEWVGHRGRDGYGVFGKPRRLAHRISYEFHVGPIPDGLTIDHLCRNRGCVNPLHLEAVTRGENVLRGESLPAQNARKTHCPQGHPYDIENTYVDPKRGWRRCRACISERNRRSRGG